MSITNEQQGYRHCHPLLLHIPHFHHKDGGGPIQMGVDQIVGIPVDIEKILM